ncbi:alpha/beta fold hydrolase [Paenibacillus caseinilyticus]|uniref:alpha/beta fold hydrolase n=1 Tax=Paenibacillus caseinilyticus TaxID=3098138 RepID=UPI0022B8E9FA|nr:alpha/beta hydrolase [Paenibacillus caseinilyticus]MCZ8521861.1 alpha/beta hydrolase [Paenibacillus caseinilyticus]
MKSKPDLHSGRQSKIYKSPEGKNILLQRYESYLNSLQIPLHREYIQTRYGLVHMLNTGRHNGKPLFILQGGNCINPMTLSWFAPLLKHYRVYAPDTIGHPGCSAENRISANDESFAHWIIDLMDHYKIPRSAFIGPSFGGGILLRLAESRPEKIACAVLVCPAGFGMGPMLSILQQIVLPMIWFKLSASEKSLKKLTDAMSMQSMKELDRQIIGEIFTHMRLEKGMPRQTERIRLTGYHAPTLIFAGKKDVFFPGDQITKRAKELIPQANTVIYNGGHFPSEKQLQSMNEEIIQFLHTNY